MSLELTTPVKNTNPQPLDHYAYNGNAPWASVTEALSGVPSPARYKGMTVFVLDGTSVDEYWFRDGTDDNHLVKYSVEDAVLYTPQTKTAEESHQARDNIGLHTTPDGSIIGTIIVETNTSTNIASKILRPGEVQFLTDTKTFVGGDGETLGGIPLGKATDGNIEIPVVDPNVITESMRNQPDGFAGLDSAGNLVGTFIPRQDIRNNLVPIVLELGELAYATDTKQWYTGDGVTPGGNALVPLYTPKFITGDYTLSMADTGAVVTTTSATDITITIPSNATSPIPIGSMIVITQEGAGQITFAPQTGVTLKSAFGLKSFGTDSFISAYKSATDTWKISGDLV